MVYYNPMSKEFQDECKRLGLTGCQLRQKYEKEGRSLEKGIYIKGGRKTFICDRCKISFNRTTGNPCKERDKEGNETGRWLCNKCKAKYYYNMPGSHGNIIKSLRDCRTGNLNPNSEYAKADNSQELACELYGWIDLNKENDSYTTPIDCYDPKTGLYHQIKMRCYSSKRRSWPFSDFRDEWEKIFEDMICFCISEDGNVVERIYKFPEKIVKDKSGVQIYKNPSRGGGGWYYEYRIRNEDELKRANDIWKEVIKDN